MKAATPLSGSKQNKLRSSAETRAERRGTNNMSCRQRQRCMESSKYWKLLALKDIRTLPKGSHAPGLQPKGWKCPELSTVKSCSLKLKSNMAMCRIRGTPNKRDLFSCCLPFRSQLLHRPLLQCKTVVTNDGYMAQVQLAARI